jgi:hypothetical protein
MSRGPGRTQRFILEVLDALPEGDWIELQVLAGIAEGQRWNHAVPAPCPDPIVASLCSGYDDGYAGTAYTRYSIPPVSASVMESFRRATKKLEARGMVETAYTGVAPGDWMAGPGRSQRLLVRRAGPDAGELRERQLATFENGRAIKAIFAEVAAERAGMGASYSVSRETGRHGMAPEGS